MGLQKLNNSKGKPLRRSLGTQLSTVGEGCPAEHCRWKEDHAQNPRNSRELDSLNSKEACVDGDSEPTGGGLRSGEREKEDTGPRERV